MEDHMASAAERMKAMRERRRERGRSSFAITLIVLFALCGTSRSRAAETVSFSSGDKVLQGLLYKPNGAGPFPAVVYNHGSAPGMLSKDAFDALGPDHIAVAGNSFGGVEAVLGAERGNYCAGVDSAGGAQSWAQAPQLQTLMTEAVRNSRTAIFFFQAENDYDLSPSKTLSRVMRAAGKPYGLKIYPPYGSSTEDGHTFGYFGSAVWADDVFRFLNRYCR
jgi:hypothetical protein